MMHTTARPRGVCPLCDPLENANIVLIAGVAIVVILGIFILTRPPAAHRPAVANTPSTANAVPSDVIPATPSNELYTASNTVNASSPANIIRPYLNSTAITPGQLDDIFGKGWYIYHAFFGKRELVDGVYNREIYINGTYYEYLRNGNSFLFAGWVAFPNATYASDYFIIRLESSLPPPHGIYGRILGNARYIYANLSSSTYTGAVMLSQDGPYVIEIESRNLAFNLTTARTVLSYQISEMNV